jgi:hypothetical protein
MAAACPGAFGQSMARLADLIRFVAGRGEAKPSDATGAEEI